MKRAALILGLVLSLTACNESSDGGSSAEGRNASENGGTTITELPGTASTVLGDYNKSAFSNYVYFHKSEDKILVDYNFFPAGTDFNSQSKIASIPCEYSVALEPEANVAVSAPVESESCEDISMSLANATFTNDGLVFSFGGSLTIFSSFEFKITSLGFIDDVSGETLAPDSSDANLEDISDLILSRRAS